jgi:hypothetical protein
MPAIGKLLPSPGADPALPNRNRGLKSAVRWAERRYYRYQPGAVLGLFAVLVAAPLALDLFVGPVRDWLDGESRHHEVGVSLLEHVLVAALVAAAAYYWVLGLKRQRALRKYRERACKRPWELVEWSDGKQPFARRAMSKVLADGIARSDESAVAVVQGRTGSGRTSFIVGLVRDLAAQKLIPVPVLARRDGSFALADLAREAFCRRIDDVLSSDEQADAIWHRARKTRDIVILVDGLDDELVEMLWRERGRRQFQTTVEALGKERFAVVFATTRDLPLGDRAPLREDLDLFNRDEASDYLQKAIGSTQDEEDVKKARVANAVAALDRLPDPVDGALVAPFYLDLLVRLQNVDVSLAGLPRQTDCWRAGVLELYLRTIESGRITPSERFGDPGATDRVARGRAAVKAAVAVANELRMDRVDLTVQRKRLTGREAALEDADELNLLWRGAERIGFASDDLGAYLRARASSDPARASDDADKLLANVREVAKGRTSRRLERYALRALIFWHLRRRGPVRLETFEKFLDDLEGKRWRRPAFAAAAVRIASSCDLTSCGPRVADAVRASLASLDGDDERTGDAHHTGESLKLVRALAEWRDQEAYALLWQLATNRELEVEWPAAKALALVADRPQATLEAAFGDVLTRATGLVDPAGMSEPTDVLGNEVASLAWILPALREDDLIDDQFGHVRELCLHPRMSPLRGEMSLAQGLKLAIVNERAVTRNVDDVRRLLSTTSSIRFWHVRLVLVQAMLAHAWNQPKEADDIERDLNDLRKNEPHPFVKRGIDLARDGLRSRRRSNGNAQLLGKYMWGHERDVVRWVEQGKSRMTQLAADVVLLSNMTYRLWTTDAAQADVASAEAALPRCIRKSSERCNITNEGCKCSQRLCEAHDTPAVLATRARFSESFCREQARLVARLGRPPWIQRGFVDKRSLKGFWDEQAELSRNGSSRAES